MPSIGKHDKLLFILQVRFLRVHTYMVSSYKYLGCLVDEHLESNEMVEEKAAAGRRALSAWLNRCKAEVGDVGVGILKKLMIECSG